jgi:Na+-driven multidrug efflux pump
MRFRLKAFVDVLRYGLPMMLVHALFPLSNLQIASAINSFDYLATAGNGAASTIENVISSTSGPFGTTVATFIGQNIGADKPDRVKKSFYQCLLWSSIISGAIGALAFLSGRLWLGLIVGFGNEEAIKFGLVRMSCTSLFYFVATLNNIYGSALQAHGYSSVSAINSIFSVFVFRIIWMQGLYPYCADLPTYQRFFMVTICFTVSWVLRLIVNVIAFAIVRVKYRRGHGRAL